MQESRTITKKSASNLALAFVLLPLLHLGDKRQGAVIGGVPAGGPDGGHIIRGTIE